MEKQLVKIVGRAEVLGRPMLYGTTRLFLEVYGLSSLDDLPRVEELRAPSESPAKADKDQRTSAPSAQPDEQPGDTTSDRQEPSADGAAANDPAPQDAPSDEYDPVDAASEDLPT